METSEIDHVTSTKMQRAYQARHTESRDTGGNAGARAPGQNGQICTCLQDGGLIRDQTFTDENAVDAYGRFATTFGPSETGPGQEKNRYAPKRQNCPLGAYWFRPLTG